MIQAPPYFFGERGRRCLQKHQMEAMKETYPKLDKLAEDGIRASTHYRSTILQDICFPSSANSHSNISEREVSHLLCDEPARLALDEFQKSKVAAQYDTFCLTLICLHALITSKVSGFETFVKTSKIQRFFISPKRVEHSATPFNLVVEDAANYEKHAVVQKTTTKSKKSERVPFEIRKRYKRFLSKEVENILCESSRCLKNALDDDNGQ